MIFQVDTFAQKFLRFDFRQERLPSKIGAMKKVQMYKSRKMRKKRGWPNRGTINSAM